jgi:hypothetical protein
VQPWRWAEADSETLTPFPELFAIWCGLWVQGSGFMVQGSGFRV